MGGILREAIIEYSDMGFEVVPCMLTVGAFGKKRLDFAGLKWKGTITRRISLTAFRRNRCNALALKTGADAGLTVIDADKSSTVSLVRATVSNWIPSAKTPGGQHWYFAHDPDIHGTRYADLRLDIKSDNGLVIVPPTEYRNGAYRWIVPIEGECPELPETLRHMLLTLQAAKRKGKHRRHPATGEKSLCELSEKQRYWIRCLIADCERAALHSRSERDFYLCVFAAKAGLSPGDLFDLCGNIGKFRERGRGYFDFTFRNAQRAAL